MYSNYIFDLYGTLVNLVIDERSSLLWEKMALFYAYSGVYYSKEELESEYLRIASLETEKVKDTKYPDIDILKIFLALYQNKDLNPSFELVERTAVFFRAVSTVSIDLYDGVLSLLYHLKKVGKRCFLLSNAQRSFSIPELTAMGLISYFDGIYFSGDIGICKPDPVFMNLLLNGENISIKNSIMIGNDHIADIGMARSLGMDTIYYHSNFSYPDPGEFDATYKILDKDITKVLALTGVIL